MSAQPRTLTPEELRARFPNASKDCIARNTLDAAYDELKGTGSRPASQAVGDVALPPIVLDPETKAALLKEPKKPKRPAKPKGMNQTERVFHEMLLKRMAAGEFLTVMYEAITLSVGEPCCRYCPDFMVVLPGGDICFYEVKGPHRWEDSTVKFKAAKKQYPFFAFEMWGRARVKDGGNWKQLL